MNYNIIAYLIYLPLSIALTIWIAGRLHKNTKAFLLKKFNGHEDLANSTNNLVQTGFYLLSLGFGFMHMRIAEVTYYVDGNALISQLTSSQQTLEQLASKLGTFTFVVGLFMFLNFFIMLAIQGANNRPKPTTITFSE